MTRRNPRTILKIIVATCLVVFVIGFVAFNSRLLLIGPEIKIISPENGTSTTTPLITLHGVTKNISYITLDDKPIFIDEEGFFTENILLSPGLNDIEIYGHDKLKRDTTNLLSLIYIPMDRPTIPTPLEDIATSTSPNIATSTLDTESSSTTTPEQ